MKTLAIIGLGLILCSCAVAVIPQATGGSRSDGVVEMSYEYGALQTPQVDYVIAQQSAERGCRNWGYTGASAFGGGVSQCVASDGFGGCNRWRVTTTYQCTGQPDN
jgi:hypothetical protein